MSYFCLYKHFKVVFPPGPHRSLKKNSFINEEPDTRRAKLKIIPSDYYQFINFKFYIKVGSLHNHTKLKESACLWKINIAFPINFINSRKTKPLEALKNDMRIFFKCTVGPPPGSRTTSSMCTSAFSFQKRNINICLTHNLDPHKLWH